MLPEQKLVALVVDDDPDIVDFMTHVLRSADCDVWTAVDGEEALRQAETCNPDVVFLDINIPDEDGWLVCSKLKIPLEAPRIVIITGRTDTGTDRFAGFVHADEVLRKPFSDDDILRVIRELHALSE